MCPSSFLCMSTQKGREEERRLFLGHPDGCKAVLSICFFLYLILTEPAFTSSQRHPHSTAAPLLRVQVNAPWAHGCNILNSFTKGTSWPLHILGGFSSHPWVPYSFSKQLLLMDSHPICLRALWRTQGREGNCCLLLLSVLISVYILNPCSALRHLWQICQFRYFELIHFHFTDAQFAFDKSYLRTFLLHSH